MTLNDVLNMMSSFGSGYMPFIVATFGVGITFNTLERLVGFFRDKYNS